MNMIEKVAKAIYYSLLPEKVGYQKGWDELAAHDQQRYKTAASKVLTEMSTPTEAMLNAPVPDKAGIYAHPVYESRRDLRPLIWKLMIDTALKSE